jgi:hypothetical protein
MAEIDVGFWGDSWFGLLKFLLWMYSGISVIPISLFRDSYLVKVKYQKILILSFSLLDNIILQITPFSGTFRKTP